MNESLPSESVKRLFLALWPTEELRHSIEHETRAAARHCGGRVTASHNFHITLAFLGEVLVSRMSNVSAAIADVAVEPFDLVLDCLSWWERPELLCLEPSTAVVGVESGITHLSALVAQLRKALRARGFALETRPFLAHVTLARNVRSDHDFKPIHPIRWPVRQMELVESLSGQRGSVYQVLGHGPTEPKSF